MAKQLPATGATWPAQQDSYGGVHVGSPAEGSLGQKAVGSGPWAHKQDSYGGVSIAPVVGGPVAGPDGT